MTTIKVTEYQGVVAAIYLSNFCVVAEDYKSLTTEDISRLIFMADLTAEDLSRSVTHGGPDTLSNTRKIRSLRAIAKKLKKDI